MIRLFFIGTFLFGLTVLCGQTIISQKKDNPHRLHRDGNYRDSISKGIQGTWVFEKDSLAYLKISKKKWVYRLAWIKADNEHTYNIEITDDYSQSVDKSGKDIFIILTNKSDTIPLKIISLTEQTISFTHYPSDNNIYTYRKKTGKLKFDKSKKNSSIYDL